MIFPIYIVWHKNELIAPHFRSIVNHSSPIFSLVFRIQDAWRLGVLHVEYERLKKKQIQQDQQS